MAARLCPGCGKAQDASNAFCPQCGRSLSAAPAPVVPPNRERTAASPTPGAAPDVEALFAQLRLSEKEVTDANRRRVMRWLYACLTAVVALIVGLLLAGGCGVAGP